MSLAKREEEKMRDENPEIENRFTYHPPKEGQPERYEQLRAGAKEMAYLIEEHCPCSRERSIALDRLDEVVFWANAAIARREK